MRIHVSVTYSVGLGLVGLDNLIARYEERGSYPKPGSWANCDELRSLAAEKGP